MKKIRSSNIEEIVVGFILALMVVTVSVGIFARYFLNKPLVFADELARYSNIWLTFLGAALVFFSALSSFLSPFPCFGIKLV